MKVRNPEYSVYLKKDKYIKDFSSSVSKQVKNQILAENLVRIDKVDDPNELVYGRSKYESMCDVFLEEDYIKCSKDTSILDVIKQFLINDLLITEDDMLKFKSDVPVKRDFIVR